MSEPLSEILNAAAYRFVRLDDPARLLEPLRAGAASRDLKGTIIVADEGINLFLAGAPDALRDFFAWLGSDALFDGAFADLVVKYSASDTRPFQRLRVKHKPEIVTMRRHEIQPLGGRAATVSPECLATWLAQGHDDDGRELLLLDTRNAFEVELGTFDGARHLDLVQFDAFPQRVEALRPDVADRTVVTFCTGGIRCEKAALYMNDAGFAHVVQLDGGILNYFERVGDDHWSGECFVFDERRTVGPSLVTRAKQPA